MLLNTPELEDREIRIRAEIKEFVRKLRPPVIGPIGHAFARFFERRDAERLARAEKRAEAIYNGLAWF